MLRFETVVGLLICYIKLEHRTLVLLLREIIDEIQWQLSLLSVIQRYVINHLFVIICPVCYKVKHGMLQVLPSFNHKLVDIPKKELT